MQVGEGHFDLDHPPNFLWQLSRVCFTVKLFLIVGLLGSRSSLYMMLSSSLYMMSTSLYMMLCSITRALPGSYYPDFYSREI